MREMTSGYKTLTEPQRKVREKRRESPSGDRLPWQGWVRCKVDGEEEGSAPHCGGNKVAAELLPLQLCLAEDAWFGFVTVISFPLMLCTSVERINNALLCMVSSCATADVPGSIPAGGC